MVASPVVWAAGVNGSNVGALLHDCVTFKVNSAPCDEFITEHYGSKADLIVAVLNSIDRHKDQARDESLHKKHYGRIMQGTLIILAFLTTALAAVARTYRDEKFKYLNVIGLLPIFASALVTMMAGFDAYYKFDAAQAQQTAVANDLAKLQSETNYELMELVGKEQEETLDFEKIKTWHGRLDGIMARYREPDAVSRSDADAGTTG